MQPTSVSFLLNQNTKPRQSHNWSCTSTRTQKGSILYLEQGKVNFSVTRLRWYFLLCFAIHISTMFRGRCLLTLYTGGSTKAEQIRFGGSGKAESTFTGIFTALSQAGSTLWASMASPFEKILYSVFELKVKNYFSLPRKFFQIFYVRSQHHCTPVQARHRSCVEPERGCYVPPS